MHVRINQIRIHLLIGVMNQVTARKVGLQWTGSRRQSESATRAWKNEGATQSLVNSVVRTRDIRRDRPKLCVP